MKTSIENTAESIVDSSISSKNLVGSNVYMYRYFSSDGSGSHQSHSEYEESMFTILLQNKDTVVISDNDFKSLKTEKYRGLTVLNEALCHLNIKDDYWGSGVMYTLYSTEVISHTDIKTGMAKMIKEQLSGITIIDMDKVVAKLDEVVK